MKKILTICFIFICGLQHAAAEQYRYNPGKAPVEVDLDVLGELRETQETDDYPQMDTIPEGMGLQPPPVTAVPLEAPVTVMPLKEPVTAAPPEMPSPPPKKKLSKPFFTATHSLPPAISPAVVAPPLPTRKPDRPQSSAQIKKLPPVTAPAIQRKPEEPVKITAPVEIQKPVPTLSDLTLDFDVTSSALSPAAQQKLDNLLVQLQEASDMRIQIRAYATGEDGNPSSARRMALSRGLMVRSYLTDKGIKPTRLDVRALGSQTNRTPLDRVDLVFVR